MKKLLFLLYVYTIIGLQFHSIIPFFTPQLNRMAGIFLGMVMLYYWWDNARVFQTVWTDEMRLWVLFILVGSVASLFVSVNQYQAIDRIMFFVQLTVLMFAMLTIVFIYGSPRLLLITNVLIFSVFILYLVATNQFNTIFYTVSSGGSKLGDIDNANSLAFMIINAVSSFVLLRVKKRKRVFGKIFSIIFITGLVFVILQTGSRKSSLSLIVYFFIWYILCWMPQQKTKKTPLKLLLIPISVVGIIILVQKLVPLIAENTYMGYRFQKALLTGSKGDQSRLTMYREAWELFKVRPLFGIGFDQFRMHSVTGMYSHSDYAEILSTTGLVGTIIYFPIYFLLSYKLFKIRRFTKIGTSAWKMSGCFLASLAVQLFLGLGSVSYSSISHWKIIIPMVGFTMLFKYHTKSAVQDEGNINEFKPNKRVCYHYRYIH